MPEHQHHPVTRVGNIDFEVRSVEPTPELRERWDHRAQALANLLLALWEEEQQQQRQQETSAA